MRAVDQKQGCKLEWPNTRAMPGIPLAFCPPTVHRARDLTSVGEINSFRTFARCAPRAASHVQVVTRVGARRRILSSKIYYWASEREFYIGGSFFSFFNLFLNIIIIIIFFLLSVFNKNKFKFVQ